MPEGPELRYMAWFINQQARNRLFNKISRSDVAIHPRKHPEFEFNSKSFGLSAVSRGKELIVTLSSSCDASIQTNILFRCGMSGNFLFKGKDQEFHKHAHLRFETCDGEAICFVDPRRFGSWQVSSQWGENRSPCLFSQWDEFIMHLKGSLQDEKLKKRPICEVMLDQSIFNGMGNYLRAEILHRSGIHPWSQAHSVIFDALDKLDSETSFLNTCRTVFDESFQLLKQYGFDTDWERLEAFNSWLQAYYKLDKAKDSQGRTMWFDNKLQCAYPRVGTYSIIKPKPRKSKSMKSPSKTTESTRSFSTLQDGKFDSNAKLKRRKVSPATSTTVSSPTSKDTEASPRRSSRRRSSRLQLLRESSFGKSLTTSTTFD